MAYSAWAVIAGEQPTAAKWNLLGSNDASFNDGSGIAWTNTPTIGAGLITSRALTNPYKFSARRTTAFTTTGAAFTKIVCDTEDFDTGNNFATGTFTAPVAGFYQFNLRTSANGNIQHVCALYKNGVVYQRGGNGAGNAVTGSMLSILVSSAANDTWDMYVYTDTAAALETGAGQLCMFSGFLVSAT